MLNDWCLMNKVDEKKNFPQCQCHTFKFRNFTLLENSPTIHLRKIHACFRPSISVHNRRTQLLLPPALNVAFRFFEPQIVELFSNEKLLRRKRLRLPSKQFFIGKWLSDSRFKNLNATFNVGGKSFWVRPISYHAASFISTIGALWNREEDW